MRCFLQALPSDKIFILAQAGLTTLHQVFTYFIYPSDTLALVWGVGRRQMTVDCFFESFFIPVNFLQGFFCPVSSHIAANISTVYNSQTSKVGLCWWQLMLAG